MKFRELDEIIDTHLETGHSVELKSGPGLGKSEYVEDLVVRQSMITGTPWGFSKLFLATQTPPDLIGYIFKGEREIGGVRYPVSEAAMPAWMFAQGGHPVSAFKRGILFLDEYGQGEADVKRASAELLLNRQLGPWRLPDGWSVIAASNRDKDRSGVTKSFDFVINRRVEYTIDPDLESWLDYAVRKKIDPAFQAFAKQNVGIVFNPDPPSKQGPWCTPRSLVKTAEDLLALGRRRAAKQGDGDFAHIPTDARALEMARGWMGDAAVQLINMIRLAYEAPTFDEIVADPQGVDVPKRPDLAMLVMYNLANRVTLKTAQPVVQYMARMPKEYATVFTQMSMRRDHKLIQDPTMRGWVLANKDMISMIGNAGV